MIRFWVSFYWFIQITDKCSMPFDCSSHFSLFCMLKLLRDYDDTKSPYFSNTRVTNERNVLSESEVFNWRKRFHPRFRGDRVTRIRRKSCLRADLSQFVDWQDLRCHVENIKQRSARRDSLTRKQKLLTCSLSSRSRSSFGDGVGKGRRKKSRIKGVNTRSNSTHASCSVV